MPTEQVQNAALPALAPLLVAVQNDLAFKDKKWSVQSGSSVDPSPPPPPEAKIGGGGQGIAPKASAAVVASADQWKAAVANPRSVMGVKTSLSVTDPAARQIEITMANSYIRYLGAYVRFYDADGKVIQAPDWTPDNGGLLYELVALCDVQYDDVRYLGYISPMNSFLGVPIGPEGKLKLKITFPKNAVSASVYGSGLGTGANPWPKTPALGGVVTAVFNLGAPALMLGFGTAAQSYAPLYKIIDELMATKGFIATIMVAGVGYSAYIVGSSVMQQEPNWSAITFAASLLFNPAATKALVWIELQITEQVVAEQIPFVGWIMLAINITTGIAQMSQTIVAVATSHWNIENKISTTVTTRVTIHPDPRHKTFPQGEAGERRTCVVKMIYQDQIRPTVSQTVDAPANSTATTLVAAFTENTLGGRVKFEADFYEGDWLAGKATTGFVPNDALNAVSIDMYLVEYPVPLSEQSIYSHARILGYTGGKYAWTDTKQAPTATLTIRDNSPDGNALGDWTGITLSQRAAMLGMSWQASGVGIADCNTGARGQLYAFQNVNIPGTPMNAVKFPSCGFGGKTRLIYDPYPPKFLMKDGNWELDETNQPKPDPNDMALGEYYVDPRPASLPYDQGGGFHLRKIELDANTPFDMSKDQPSWGRFAYFPDSVCMHPSGLVIGVSAQYQKLQVVTLVESGRRDIDVPLGTIGSGPALNADRPGLMFYPVAVTCTYDGTILVLEDTKSSTGTAVTAVSRLSAYDLQMNPVSRFFDENGNPSPWLYLANSADFHYLDVSSVGDEKMTYIYILYYAGSGATPSDYHMAIYTYGPTKPAKNPLVTTDNVAAAKLAVDMWHSAYTLNFPMTTDENGKPAGPKNSSTGPAGRTVPSVSMWVPPKPKS